MIYIRLQSNFEKCKQNGTYQHRNFRRLPSTKRLVTFFDL